MAIRYAFDELNRLVVGERRPTAERVRPSRLVEGTVTTDAGNRLLYLVESPAGADGRLGPHRYHLDGTWALTRGHELSLTLHEGADASRQTLYLKGTLAEARARALTFALWRQGPDGRRTAQRLSLTGRWQADRTNRLTFLVEKADGSEDRLTFDGAWSVGARHELLYRYRLRTGPRLAGPPHTLRFSGVWDIRRADRLVYQVEGSPDSAFEFRASLQRPSLNAREGRLVYQVGIGLSRGRTQTQRVALFGTWKLNRDFSISFEVPYAGGRVHAIRFEGTYALTSRNRIAVALQGRREEPLGLTVTFTRDLAPDAGLFLRLHRDDRERSAIGGVQVRF